MKDSGVRTGEWLELPGPPAGGNVPEWLAGRYPVPAKLLGRLRAEGGIRQRSGRLSLRLFPAEEAQVQAQWADLDVLYETTFCLVAAKPAGMPVHPAFAGQQGTLAHALAAHDEATGQRCRIRHIHRLERIRPDRCCTPKTNSPN